MNWTERLLESISKEELLDIVKGLIEIPSHSDAAGEEREVGTYLAELLEEESIEVFIQEVTDGRFNVIGRLPGIDQGSLMLNGHIDTVPPGGMEEPFMPRIKDGRLFGRGAVDMKGAVGAMAYTAILLKRNSISLDRDLIFAGVIGEETGSTGTDYLVNHGPRAEMALVGEPTDLQPVIAHKGIEWIEVTINGKTSHGSIPEQGINAIEKTSKSILGFKDKIADKFSARSHELMGKPTVNIGTIRGGERPNIVPSNCTIQIDRRYLPELNPGDVAEEIRGIFTDLEGEIPELEVQSVRRMEQTKDPLHPPLNTEPDHPLTQSLSRAVTQVGRNDEFKGVDFWTDASLLSYAASTPSLVCGPGNIDQAHSASEYVPIEQLVEATEIYLLTVLDICRKG